MRCNRRQNFSKCTLNNRFIKFTDFQVSPYSDIIGNVHIPNITFLFQAILLLLSNGLAKLIHCFAVGGSYFHVLLV